MTKVTSIEAALADSVGPGSHVHLALGQSRPNLAIRELLRRFDGQEPGLHVSATGMGGAQLGPFLLVAGLIRKLETSFVGDQFPRPGPNRGANAALAGVDVRPWSLLTMIQRIQAGAAGQEWAITDSLLDSSLIEDNPDVRRVEELTLIRALRPDVTLLHGIVADPDGNTVLSTPVGEALPAAVAARDGAVVTVEEVVSPAELRSLVGQPVLPGAFVRHVTEMRHGAHPAGLLPPRELEHLGYGEDYAFMAEASRALCAPEDERRAWIRQHLLPADLADGYLEGLGTERLRHLDAWRAWPAAEPDLERPATAEERLATFGARAIRERVAAGAPDNLLAGIGISCLAVWLAREGQERFPHLISELGLFDYDPVAGNPFLFYFPNLATAACLTDATTVLGGMLRARPASTVAVVSAGQVDRHGNLNTTRTERGWISGSGGANDIVSAVPTVALMLHRRGRVVESVDYVTSPGRNVATLVTDRGRLDRDPDSGELVLTGVHADDGDLAAAVRETRAATPWPLAVAPEVAELPGPTASDLATLRRYDPAGGVLGTEAA